MNKIYSPLRYPGGKTKVLNFMKEIIKNNFSGTKPQYVEPYVGGAGVALGLLLQGCVSEIHINDYDPVIYSFWDSIKKSPQRLINRIKNTDITVEEWHNQKKIMTEKKIGFDLGFATFFLNRCNRSGVIKGGCIGGLKQEGNYKIDCRFNKKDLIQRIENIIEYRDRINIYNQDALVLLQEPKIKEILKDSLLYLDPPYYVKGCQLYRNHYKHDDHSKIASLMENIDTRWIVSYDNVVEIRELYKKFNKKEFDLMYTAGTIKKGKEIMFFSDSICNIPDTI